MKKQLVIIIAALLCIQHSSTKIVMGSVAFLSKVGRKLPQFGRVENKKADIFSTPFLFPIKNSEIIKPFLPEPIKHLLHKHSYANVNYWIRISTSVNNHQNIEKEYEAIPMPWSILFHGWAYHTAITHPKTIEWGFYDPIAILHTSSTQNYLGYEEGIWAKAKNWWNKNPITRNTLHKEHLSIEDDGPTYTKALPINEKRCFMNFWTLGYIHDAAINRNDIVVIYEFVIKEPTFKTRKNRIEQGVFYPDLKVEEDFDYIYKRLNDYNLAIKKLSYNNTYEPERPFSQDLEDTLKKISRGSYHIEDEAALENFTHTIKDMYQRIKQNPLTSENIHKLAETYAEELHLGQSEYSITRSISKIAPNATQDQIQKIIHLAKIIHENHLQNIESHIKNIHENKGYKEYHEKEFNGIYESIQPIYRTYAKNLFEKKDTNSKERHEELEYTEEFEQKLKEALQIISTYAHESDSYNDFLDKCEENTVDKKILHDETYQTAIFHHSKKFIIHDIEKIYETLQYAIDNQPNPLKMAQLKELLKETMQLNEKVTEITSLQNEDKLVTLINNELPKINARFIAIIEDKNDYDKKGAPLHNAKYEDIIQELTKLETTQTYAKFVDFFNKLKGNRLNAWFTTINDLYKKLILLQQIDLDIEE